MKRALICGISGQDGAYLTRHLLQRGYTVVGTSRDDQSSSFANLQKLGLRQDIETVSMALTDFRSVFQTLSKVRPDEVYNLAGQSSVGLSFQQPVETFESVTIGVINLLESIRILDKPIRLYNAGSSETFGDTGGQAADENTPFRPVSPYAMAKAAAYWAVANYRSAYKLYACTGLLFNHESPLRPRHFVTRKIVTGACDIKRGSKKNLELGQLSIRRDWGWAPEYVDAMWRMLQLDTPEDFVIATGKSISLEDFCRATFAAVGLDHRDHVTINSSFIRPSEILYGQGNPQKARDILGWHATHTVDDIVKMMIDAEMTGATY